MSDVIRMNDYQRAAAETAIYPGAGTSSPAAFTYLLLKLNGETGEVGEKYAKMYRDGTEWDAFVDDAILELGDVLWYVAMIAKELGIPLTQIAAFNLEKLRGRHGRGTLGGSGDHR